MKFIKLGWAEILVVSLLGDCGECSEIFSELAEILGGSLKALEIGGCKAEVSYTQVRPIL